MYAGHTVCVFSASARVIRCSGLQDLAACVLRVISIHMLRNGLYGFTARFLSWPIMWSLPAATRIPASRYDRSGKKYRMPSRPKTFSSAGPS